MGLSAEGRNPGTRILGHILGLRPKAEKNIGTIRPKAENFREIVEKNIGARSAPEIFGVFIEEK